MARILILEDDIMQNKALEILLSDYREPLTVISATTIKDAKEHLLHYSFDLFLLDIYMNETAQAPANGINFGQLLRSLPQYQNVPIIFLTAIPELIQQALTQTHCYQYILKPYSKEELFHCLDDVFQNSVISDKTFHFQSFWGGRIRIPQKNILYFMPNSMHRICVVTSTGQYETNEYTLNELTALLKPDFFRCHRKYLVNFEKITDYDKSNRLIYINEKTLPLGRTVKSQFEFLWGSR